MSKSYQGELVEVVAIDVGELSVVDEVVEVGLATATGDLVSTGNGH